MALRWLDDITADGVDSVGGKAASLGELATAGLPVPPAFVVTADTYRRFIESTGIDDELFAALDVDADDSRALADAAERAQSLVRETPVPEDVREQVLAAHEDLDHDAVAVRSSATAEDLPDASFAGQQETYLNVGRADLLDRVKDCWASLYTQRAIYYRQEQGFAHDAVDIAVVVQAMVDADESGVLFTSHPSTGDPTAVIEAAWGLGEAVVSGAVSPDNYVVDRETGEVLEVTVGTKKVEYVRDGTETVERPVPDDRREERVLSAEDLERLVALGARVEDHYDAPQDVEWAIADDDVYLLQSRPITTIDETVEASASTSTKSASTGTDRSSPADATGPSSAGATGTTTTDATGSTTADGSGPSPTDGPGTTPLKVNRTAPRDGPGDRPSSVADGGAMTGQTEGVLADGLGASPGTASGTIRTVRKLDQLDKVEDGDVIVTEMTTPDMVPAMKRATAIVTDEGGMTSHAAIVSRELGVPAVVGTGDGSARLQDGQEVTVEGDRGTVRAGAAGDAPDAGDATDGETPGGGTTDAGSGGGTADAGSGTGDASTGPAADSTPAAASKPMTGTEIKVNVSIPAAAERAAATGADGVGLLRIEHMILSTGKTPERYVADHDERAFSDEIVEGVRTVAESFYPRPVRVRTLDAPTDEFRQLEGGSDEPSEHNPMLGYRGIRRSLGRPETFRLELAAIRRLYELGYDNVEVMLPLVTDAEDVLAARTHLEEAGIDTTKRSWGVMVETPASALCIEDLCETGIDFASFGTNDLTQYTLAVDRNNEHVADRFDELHPAVLELIGRTIETCREHDVATSICGQAGSKPEMVRYLVNEGITSISANVDAVHDVQQAVKRVEQRLLLESVR